MESMLYEYLKCRLSLKHVTPLESTKFHLVVSCIGPRMGLGISDLSWNGVTGGEYVSLETSGSIPVGVRNQNFGITDLKVISTLLAIIY